jgi:hypothetical protein
MNEEANLGWWTKSAAGEDRQAQAQEKAPREPT